MKIYQDQTNEDKYSISVNLDTDFVTLCENYVHKQSTNIFLTALWHKQSFTNTMSIFKKNLNTPDI